ncbi:general odorant-binding protein 56a-like [Microplitis mediator]|uniref:general odorant-binding protein 56a-like n=1 Tax=Microplitis mediator TaxID=375433 RepID=UPI00255420CC|nr:general odorant-binding protein 56a-like [Microplitis mediator]
MKIFAVIIAVCFVGAVVAIGDLTEEERVKLDEHAKACVNETGFYDTNADTGKKDKWITYGFKLQCYFSCMLKKMNIMNEDGALNEEMIRKKMADELPADQIDVVYTKCKDLKGANMCETAMVIMKCYDDERALLKPTEKSV